MSDTSTFRGRTGEGVHHAPAAIPGAAAAAAAAGRAPQPPKVPLEGLVPAGANGGVAIGVPGAPVAASPAPAQPVAPPADAGPGLIEGF